MMKKVAPVIELDFKTHEESYETRTTEWGGRDPLDFEGECDYVLNFMKTRLQWMDQEFGQ